MFTRYRRYPIKRVIIYEALTSYITAFVSFLVTWLNFFELYFIMADIEVNTRLIGESVVI